MADSATSLAHQFDDLDQQRHAAELGMWVFLATEVLFFGGLIAGYTVYRIQFEPTFAAASQHSNLLLGTINTAVLLTSSLLMALSVQAAQARQQGRLIACLAGTWLLGAAFLGIKGYEYHEHAEQSLAPVFGLPFRWPGSDAQHAELFFDLYFLMTGVHALHMVIGLGVLGVLLALACRGQLLGERSTPVHVSGLYWHFVDVVWVFLFPFFYLVGSRGGH